MGTPSTRGLINSPLRQIKGGSEPALAISRRRVAGSHCALPPEESRTAPPRLRSRSHLLSDLINSAGLRSPRRKDAQQARDQSAPYSAAVAPLLADIPRTQSGYGCRLAQRSRTRRPRFPGAGRDRDAHLQSLNLGSARGSSTCWSFRAVP